MDDEKLQTFFTYWRALVPLVFAIDIHTVQTSIFRQYVANITMKSAYTANEITIRTC